MEHRPLCTRKCLVMGVILLSGVLAGGHKAAAQANRVPEIWFTPMQNAVKADGVGVTITQHDFLAMMAHPEQWPHAKSRISEMTLDTVHFVENRVDLPAIVAWSNHQNFQIGATGSIVYTDHICNPHMEGITDDDGVAREIAVTTHAWKAAGGKLDYFIMDSPLVFGYYAAQAQCHFSIEEVAVRAATTVKAILEDYPNVKIVDAEGPASMLPAAWLPDYERFLSSFQKASARPIDYLAMDMHWFDDWHTGYNWVTASREIIAFVHARGVKVGLIINADDRFVEVGEGIEKKEAVTAKDWMQANRNHMQIAHDEKLQLDAIIINSWMKFPKWNLPESDPNAYASLVNDAYRIWAGHRDRPVTGSPVGVHR